MELTIHLEPEVAAFYERFAKSANLSLEDTIAEVLHSCFEQGMAITKLGAEGAGEAAAKLIEENYGQAAKLMRGE